MSVSDSIVQKWTEENGVIRLSVTSDGRTGKNWVTDFKKKGFGVNASTKSVLRSRYYEPTVGITSSVVILRGDLFPRNDLVSYKICTEAERRRLIKPNAEVACLVRKKFSDKELEEMGLLWIVVFHNPIKDFDGDDKLLGVWPGNLRACDGRRDCRWHPFSPRHYGAAFIEG